MFSSFRLPTFSHELRGDRLNWFRWTALVATLFFLQQLPVVSDLGVDLPLVFVILVGLRSTAAPASGWGFLMGFLQDLLSAGWLGPNVVGKTLTGALCAYFRLRIYREKVITQTGLVFVAAIFHQGLVWAVKLWDGSAPGFSQALWICWKTALGTTLAGFIASIFLVRFRRRRHDPATA
jgi:rod shape-determining protein MreD